MWRSLPASLQPTFYHLLERLIMNSNTSTPMVSIPSGVYDLESLKSECCLLGIPPSRPNIRRVRKALDIVDAPDAITNVANFADRRLYLVRSQTRADSSYYVQSTDSQVECTCPDSAKGNACKHGFAVRLHEERLADQAKYDQWLCEQYEADKAREDDLCFTYDPSVDPPIDFPID